MPATTQTVLVIDDDADFCQLLTSILELQGYIASAACTLADATKSMNSMRPHIILLDNNLPDGKGIDHVPVIRTLDPNIVIVMVTADANTMLAVEAREKGVKHFLRKPFTFKTILDLLSSINVKEVV